MRLRIQSNKRSTAMAPVLESICDKNPTQKEAIAMDYLNHITDHEKVNTWLTKIMNYRSLLDAA